MLMISDTMSGRDNNYHLLRFLAACFIAYYHCYFMVLGLEMQDDRYPGLYLTSQMALNFFFIASGFLIAQSFERRKDIISYIIARFLRLIPGVFVLSLVMVFLIGPLVTEVSLATYFSALKTWGYIPLTSLLQPDATLPGVFASNPNPLEIDTALWTLRYEVICYVGLAFLGLMGGLKLGATFYGTSLLVFLAYAFITYGTSLREIAFVNHIMHFGLSFYIGTVFYVYRAAIPLSGFITLVCLLACFGFYYLFGPLAEPLMLVAVAYIVFWLAYIPGGWLRSYNNLGDFSYGVYIYHYPTQQVLMYAIGGFSITGLYLISLPIVLLIAICSWIFVERPALQQLSRLTLWVKSQLRIRAF